MSFVGLRTKIVVTVGDQRRIYDPDDKLRDKRVRYEEMIPWLVEEGVDVFRLNMSHKSRDGRREIAFFEAYRSSSHVWERDGRQVAILVDNHLAPAPLDVIALIHQDAPGDGPQRREGRGCDQ